MNRKTQFFVPSSGYAQIKPASVGVHAGGLRLVNLECGKPSDGARHIILESVHNEGTDYGEEKRTCKDD